MNGCPPKFQNEVPGLQAEISRMLGFVDSWDSGRCGNLGDVMAGQCLMDGAFLPSSLPEVATFTWKTPNLSNLLHC